MFLGCVLDRPVDRLEAKEHHAKNQETRHRTRRELVRQNRSRDTGKRRENNGGIHHVPQEQSQFTFESEHSKMKDNESFRVL